MALYKEQKARLHALLATCIESGRTAKETKNILHMAKNSMCNECYLYAMAHGYGRAFCDKNNKCFLEDALNTYCAVAERECVKDADEDDTTEGGENNDERNP